MKARMPTPIVGFFAGESFPQVAAGSIEPRVIYFGLSCNVNFS